MKRHIHSTTVHVSPEVLYAALTDLRRWPEWDAEISSIDHNGTEPKPGDRFILKPKGGPKTTLFVEVADEPTRFTDVALLPLGKMRTTHEFLRRQHKTTLVQVTIETYGPLGLLWDRLIAGKQADGAVRQIQALAAFAERSFA